MHKIAFLSLKIHNFGIIYRRQSVIGKFTYKMQKEIQKVWIRKENCRFERRMVLKKFLLANKRLLCWPRSLPSPECFDDYFANQIRNWNFFARLCFLLCSKIMQFLRFEIPVFWRWMVNRHEKEYLTFFGNFFAYFHPKKGINYAHNLLISRHKNPSPSNYIKAIQFL